MSRSLFENSPKGGIHDLHPGAHGNTLKNAHDIFGAHPDTSVTHRPTNEPLHRGAVDVDTSPVSPCVARLKSPQTQDPRHNGVPARRVGTENLSGRPARLKNCPSRRTVSDFVGHSQVPQRSRKTLGIVTQTKTRSGHRELRHVSSGLNHAKPLFRHTDHDPRCGRTTWPPSEE
jgi:hypothetical protein